MSAARTRTVAMAAGEAARSTPFSTATTTTLFPQEEAAAEVVARVLGDAVQRSAGADGVSLVYPDGRLAVLEEATLGEREDLRLAHLRRESDMQWPAPGRWWWQVRINDVRQLPRVREVFPVAARACEATGVPNPGGLPAKLLSGVPDLHWLTHTAPAQLIGHPTTLDRPATVTLGRIGPTDRGMESVVPALREWSTGEVARRALSRLHQRRADERQLYLTVGCTGLPVDAFAALVRGEGVPPEPPPSRLGVSHLWLAPVLGLAVFLWSSRDGWSRYEPYG